MKLFRVNFNNHLVFNLSKRARTHTQDSELFLGGGEKINNTQSLMIIFKTIISLLFVRNEIGG